VLAEDRPMTTEDLRHGFERDLMKGNAVNLAAHNASGAGICSSAPSAKIRLQSGGQ